MAEVLWAEPALRHVQEIIDYVAQHSVVAAEKLQARLLEAPEILRRLPEIGSRVPGFDVDTMRELLVKPYRVLYVYREDICTIFAVVHGSRDLSRCLKPEDWQSL